MDTVDINRWKKNSIKTAREMNFFFEGAYKRLEDVDIEINYKERPADVWYGRSHYGLPWNGRIEIYSENAASDFYSTRKILEEEGVPEEDIEFCRGYVNEMGEGVFREIFNQSGMDHELIGHMGNFVSFRPHGEVMACTAQFQMATHRGKSDKDWAKGAAMMSKILPYHKKGFNILRI